MARGSSVPLELEAVSVLGHCSLRCIESNAEPTLAPEPALVSAVLESSSDAGCGAAIGGSGMSWRRHAAHQWRRPVITALHFRLREVEGVERAALAVAP